MVTIIGRADTIVVDDSEEVVTRELMPTDMGMMSFTDGVYTTAVRYEIPYGYIEPMEVSLTFKDGIVTDADVAFDVVNPVSIDYQNLFKESYKDEVIGQSIKDVSLARMGGASLTNGAFDAALRDIKEQAATEPMMRDRLPVSITLPAAPTAAASQSIINSVTVDVQGGVTEYVVDHAYTINPFLTEPMKTTIVVEAGIITDAEVAFNSPDQISIMHQEVFVDEFYDEIVGQPIDTASLARVSFASLTTKAFNDALEEIQLEEQI
jgi:hypothetical protein